MFRDQSSFRFGFGFTRSISLAYKKSRLLFTVFTIARGVFVVLVVVFVVSVIVAVTISVVADNVATVVAAVFAMVVVIVDDAADFFLRCGTIVIDFDTNSNMSGRNWDDG